MSIAVISPTEPLQMGLFGKVRESFSSNGHINKSISDQSNLNIKSHTMSPSSDSDVKVKGRRGVWRKGSNNVKPVISNVAPALSLNFENKEEPPAHLTTRHHNSLPRKFKSNGSINRKKSISAPTPSPAAAIALAAASKKIFATPEAQVKYHQNARLRVKQITVLIQFCSQEIKMRGLATLGIFRPFRAAESLQQQERLVELFLLYIDPKTYDGVFSAGDATNTILMADAFGRVDAEGEFKKKLSYANIYDVIALLKWGLRRLKLQSTDFNSTTWYETFVEREKEAEYPAKAYSEIFLSILPTDTQQLFDSILDLMSTISAHHVANAMSASKICKTLGFWIVGRIGVDHPPHDLPTLVEAWKRSAQIMEHLLMAFVRDQASKVHLMPSRLTEIVKDYPHFGLGLNNGGQDIKAPCLKTRYSTMPIRALYIEIQSENIIVSDKRPRGPRDTLRAALKAQGADLEASEELDDWSALLGITCNVADTTSEHEEMEILMSPKMDLDNDDEITARKEASLFSEDDTRVMRIVSAEYERRRAKSEAKHNTSSTKSSMNQNSSFLSDLSSIDVDDEYGFSSQSTELLGWSSNIMPVTTSSYESTKSSLKPRSSTLSKDLTQSRTGKVDWNEFTSDGFENAKQVNTEGDLLDLKLNQAYKAKSELEKVIDEHDRVMDKSTVKRRGSISAMRRKRPHENHHGSNLQDSSSFNNSIITQKSTHALQKVSLMALDETFIHFWQDQLLDDCIAARLPYLLVANLNKLTSSRLLGTGMGQAAHSTNWLLISESISAPRPPLPQGSRPGRTLSLLRRRNSSTANVFKGDENNYDSGKRSIFTPSIKSNWTASMSRTKDGFKKMSSMLNLRKSSFDQMQDQERVDGELAEIQKAADNSR